MGITDIAISYNRPVARGRELFGTGGIVRPGRVWHPGADSATTISFSRDVSIDGHDLAAGRYTLWTIPPPESLQPWTVIFSRALGVWHTPYPGEASDVLRLTGRRRTGRAHGSAGILLPCGNAGFGIAAAPLGQHDRAPVDSAQDLNRLVSPGTHGFVPRRVPADTTRP